MSTSRYMNRICVIAAVIALLVSVLFMNGAAFGIPARAAELGYEDKLFDTSKVHTIDILIDDWDTFLATARSEAYSICDVVIDGEPVGNVGIRGKGNTSLSTVASMDSDRYSFKIEFDQYDSGKTYHGLDKLSLNNLIQDNTMMKDYLTYQMMGQFGVPSPLCSFVYITVNGEDWGLYLAVEAVEESFLQRNYGSGYGDLYKPDSMDMGGGRGNGKDFNFDDFLDGADASASATPGGTQDGQTVPGNGPGMPGNFDPSQSGGMMPGGNGDGSGQPAMPGNFDLAQSGGMMPGGNGDGSGQPAMPGNFDPAQMGGGFGMGSDSTRLQYIDDQISSYSVIFDSAKTDATVADQRRLIESLKDLSAQENLESVLNIEDVIRYFVVHNFVVNADSYTGSMIHNYYLYEEDGRLSMIPWDYNLAFGTFQGGSATKMVSDDIDAPLSVTGSGRPMIDWIFGSEAYTEIYHAYFREFLDTVDPAAIISQAEELIAPYVDKDPTKFCTSEEFEKGVASLAAFCDLRSQSVAAQLDGGDGIVDTSSITLSDMGTMNRRMDGGQTGPTFEAGTGENQPFAGMDGQSGMMPGESGFPQRDPTSAFQTGGSWISIGISVMILLGGLLFVFKFKR